MKKYGLLGKSLGHSFSPALHTCFFDIENIQGQYDLIALEEDQLEDFFKKDIYTYEGINVTLPYKVKVMSYLQALDPKAKSIGAVNTIKVSQGGLKGYNTDYDGFYLLLKQLEGQLDEVEDKAALILGTGGASQAVMAALIDGGYGKIYWATRSLATKKEPSKWEKICKEKGIILKRVAYEGLENILIKGAFIVVNTTPSGMFPEVESCPLEEGIIEKAAGVIDLIYNPEETLLMKKAKAYGLPAVGGMDMLLMQGIKAEALWQEKRYERDLLEKVKKKLSKNR